jgi:ABC-type transport system involved in multi-copper enzyme maturation permease subunit
MSPVLMPMVRATLIESIRRKDLAVVAIFAVLLLAFLGAARWVGLERPASGTFLLNLSLTLALYGAQLVTVLVAARQFPEEIEHRTLYPLLARPIRRRQMVLAKWAACSCMGIGLAAVLVLPVLLLVPKLEPYSLHTLFQLLGLQPFALMTSAAIAMALSLLLPRGLALAAALGVVFGADLILRLGARLPVVHLLPDPMRLNLTLRYTDGIGPLPAAGLLSLMLAAGLWTLAMLLLADYRFTRRAL